MKTFFFAKAELNINFGKHLLLFAPATPRYTGPIHSWNLRLYPVPAEGGISLAYRINAYEICVKLCLIHKAVSGGIGGRPLLFRFRAMMVDGWILSPKNRTRISHRVAKSLAHSRRNRSLALIGPKIRRRSASRVRALCRSVSLTACRAITGRICEYVRARSCSC